MNTSPTPHVTGADSRETEAVQPLEVERPTRRPFRSALGSVRVWLAGTSRSRRVTAAGGSIATAAVAIGIILATEPTGSTQGASTPPSGGGTTAVQYRDLISTDTESGTLGYASLPTKGGRR
jgi:hypothetical protein